MLKTSFRSFCYDVSSHVAAIQRNYYNKAKRLAKKIGGRIEIERYGTENNYWVFGPDKVENHPDWKDDEHFQTCWVGVYDFLIEVVDFIEEKNL